MARAAVALWHTRGCGGTCGCGARGCGGTRSCGTCGCGGTRGYGTCGCGGTRGCCSGGRVTGGRVTSSCHRRPCLRRLRRRRCGARTTVRCVVCLQRSSCEGVQLWKLSGWHVWHQACTVSPARCSRWLSQPTHSEPVKSDVDVLVPVGVLDADVEGDAATRSARGRGRCSCRRSRPACSTVLTARGSTSGQCRRACCGSGRWTLYRFGFALARTLCTTSQSYQLKFSARPPSTRAAGTRG